ncbi:hypothetical protein [Flavobacterium sp.]|uniref:hypothetical protein n=1 Tax=Flavobacterium sp. TaxID=239 RepID=UPI004048CFDF
MKNLLNTVLCLAIATLTFSCSSDDDSNPTPMDERNFTTNTNPDFFINRDGTVNLTVTGEYTEDSSIGNVSEIGFVYGTNSNPEVNANNTVSAIGQNTVEGEIRDLVSGQPYFIRGYLKMSDGSYFYGNEIQASTDVDASTTRSLIIDMKPTPFLTNTTLISVEFDVTEVTKESPTEIGVEYSLNSDFSNSSIALNNTIPGNVFITTYSASAENLTSATTYHFRPYAKYADGTVSNGGTSTADFTTN